MWIKEIRLPARVGAFLIMSKKREKCTKMHTKNTRSLVELVFVQ